MADVNLTENNAAIPANEEDDMEVVTMVDVLKEEQELEEDTKAVLGASDDKNCTYSKGYIARQALYACMTCIPATDDLSKAAGVCLACSYKCHEGHMLIELYTKRNFRCDCGNKKFESNKCSLETAKEDGNELNTYNQNFFGLYCTCKRPYPDPDDEVNDEMIQCAACEDWYHLRHLTVQGTIPEQYSEMICHCCVEKYKFLINYPNLNKWNITEQPKIESETSKTAEDVLVAVQEENKIDATVTETNIDVEQVADCKMPVDNSANTICSAIFWHESWRSELCKCARCVAMYQEHKISFVTEYEDTVKYYEDKGKEIASTCTQYEAGLEALSSLDRIKQVEAISEYNVMKNHLKEYLQKFVDNGKVVREEDIKEFFSTMSERKKQRTEIPHYCR